MPIIFLLAALAASISWAISSMMAYSPARYLGAFEFARIQLSTSSIALILIVTLIGGWATVSWGQWPTLVISGVVGILLGDLALHSCLRRGGPRRTQILFSMNAPFAAILGYLFYGETIPLLPLLGGALTFLGVVLAILFNRKPTEETDLFEKMHGPIIPTVLFGLAAALCQAIGLIALKPAILAGTDPFAASALRTAGSALILILASLWPAQIFRPLSMPTRKMILSTTIAGILGYVVAMTLLLYALKNYNTGIVAVLGSTTPVMMLPILWITTKNCPPPLAWLGAIMVVVGTALMLGM